MDVIPPRFLKPLDREVFELVFGDHGDYRSGDLRLNKQVIDFVCIRSSKKKLGGLRLNEIQTRMVNFCLAIYLIRPNIRLLLAKLCREICREQRNNNRIASELPQSGIQ